MISPQLPKITPKTFDNKVVTIKSAALNLENLINGKKIPVKNPYFIAPVIEAAGVISVDSETGTVLYEKNAHQKLAFASITKLMTILIVLEENNLSDTVKISGNAANTEGSKMFLRAGEEIALENLIYGAIIGSANDAATALAEHNAGTVSAFVEKMNTKAKELGLLNTHFSNPVGLDDKNNYSSAYDVAKMAQYIYKHSFIRHAAQLKSLEVKSISGNFTHKLETTNDLLSDELFKFEGLKTGSTNLAGLCLVSYVENDNGNEILTVVLNSPARFTETKILTDWTFRAYKW
ncbi:D-alanyl-D-alanine carboxypeptidase [Candidatus Peregrinibacteria bacterium]|nr:D-alanyl-D-alanine carboxypeptidase [Candidatus Peregrinibacteria bacterium]